MVNNRSLITWSLSLILVLSLGLAVAGGEGELNAKGVIVEEVVPESEFNVTVSTDRTRYAIGEVLNITVKSSKSGYLTLYDIQPDGKVNLLFPNRFHGDQKIQGDKTYRIPAPSDSFRFRVSPPRGRDILWAVVSSEPGKFPLKQATEDSPFPQMAKDAEEFAQNVKGVSVEQKQAWGAGYSVFYIGEPLGGHVHVTSYPRGASIYLDGSYRGKSPMTIYDLKPGRYEISLAKSGYQDYTSNVQVTSGTTTNVSPKLVPVAQDPKINSVSVSPSPSNEGESVTFSARATSLDGSPLTYTWEIDGTKYSGKDVRASFDDNMQVNWYLQVKSGHGGITERNGSHNVENLLPQINSVKVTPEPSREGEEVSFEAQASDPGDDQLSYVWTVEGTQISGRQVSLTFHDNGEVDWSLEVSDGDGGVATRRGTHTVNNVVPTIHSVEISPSPSTVGENVSFIVQASDPGRDTLSYTWEIGGTEYHGPKIGVPFASPGQYNWSVRISDGDSGVASKSGLHRVNRAEPTTTDVYVSVPEEGKVMKAMYGILGFKTVARNLDHPYGITCSPSGRLYIAENGANRIVAVGQGGSQVEVIKELAESPLSLTFGPSGDLFFTTDQGNIWRLSDGTLEKLVPEESSVKGVSIVQERTFAAEESPYDIEFIKAGEHQGDMLVSLATPSPGRGRVVRLPGPNYDRVVPFIDSYQLADGEGKAASLDLETLTGLATSRSGAVYVGVQGKEEQLILQYSGAGKFLEVFTGDVSKPNELAVDWHERVYAATSSFSGGEVSSGALRRYNQSAEQTDVISHTGIWGVAICES